jgi:transposase
MRLIHDILFRLRSGQSERAVADDLGHSRVTVHRYHLLAQEKGYLDPARPLPDPAALLAELGPPSPAPRAPSTIEPLRKVVLALAKQGVEGVAIHQRLTEDHGYTGSYSSVRRFLRRARPTEVDACVRVETPPGHQAQVDFGAIGKLRQPKAGELRAAYSFVMTLSSSRHQYVEFVFDQKMPTWIGLHRRAFESFGGVPKEIVLDNLKAGVILAAMEDTVLSDGYRQMAQHYGVLIHPCRPRTPEHKGKVESGVHYVERNFIAGRTFMDIADANRQVKRWVTDVAGVRDHGTTHQAPLARFREQEQAALLPLPSEPFALLAVHSLKLHGDCHVRLEKSYYSAPHTAVGKILDVYLFEKTVQIYDGLTLLTSHVRATDAGTWRTRTEHYPADKAIWLIRTPEYCREKAVEIGPACREVIDALLSERPLDNRTAAGNLVGLQETVGALRLEAACRRALFFGDPHYRRVKSILAAGLESDPLPGESHACNTGTSARAYTHAREMGGSYFEEEAA